MKIGFEWAATYCNFSRFLLKLDDDVFVYRKTSFILERHRHRYAKDFNVLVVFNIDILSF